MRKIIPFSLYIAISIILIISIIHTNSHLKKYDKYFVAENGIKYHGVINEAPLFYILIEAQKFKNKLSKKKNEKNLYKLGYKSHFLPSKIVNLNNSA